MKTGCEDTTTIKPRGKMATLASWAHFSGGTITVEGAIVYNHRKDERLRVVGMLNHRLSLSLTMDQPRPSCLSKKRMRKDEDEGDGLRFNVLISATHRSQLRTNTQTRDVLHNSPHC